MLGEWISLSWKRQNTNQSLPEGVVRRPLSLFLNKGRNVNKDNFFTSESKIRSEVETLDRVKKEVLQFSKTSKHKLYNTKEIKFDENIQRSIRAGNQKRMC